MEDDPDPSEYERGLCGVKALKTIMIIYNVLLLLSGIGLAIIGIWSSVTKHSYISLLAGVLYESITYLVISCSLIIIFIIFIIGCLGAIKEYSKLLIIYGSMLALVFLMEIIGGVVAYAYHAKIEEELTSQLNVTITSRYHNDTSLARAVDEMHTQFRCCGAVSFRDWRLSVRKFIPDSCCKSPSPGCSSPSQHPSNIHYRGCVDSLKEFLMEHIYAIATVTVGLCAIQVLGVVLSFWFARRLREWKICRYASWMK